MNALKSVVLVVSAFALAGCIVAPTRHAHEAPPGVAYVAPTYASPGEGYAWGYHEQHGWGWRHPQKGWHRGWR